VLDILTPKKEDWNQLSQILEAFIQASTTIPIARAERKQLRRLFGNIIAYF